MNSSYCCEDEPSVDLAAAASESGVQLVVALNRGSFFVSKFFTGPILRGVNFGPSEMRGYFLK